MTITLSAETEQRFQRQLDRGQFKVPADVLAHALDLLEAEEEMDGWLLRNRDAIDADLNRTFAQAEQGDGYSAEESLASVEEHRAARAA